MSLVDDRVVYQAPIQGEARERLDAITERGGLKKHAFLARLLDWYGTAGAPLQLAILHHGEPGMDDVLADLVVKHYRGVQRRKEPEAS